MTKQDTILVIGAAGQIGTDLVLELRQQYGISNVIAADIKTPAYEIYEGGPFEILDVLNPSKIYDLVKKYNVSQVYLLAALLSATAEQNPDYAWNLNMNSLFHILDLAANGHISKIFWPSSIAVFGPNSPKINCPQFCVTDPQTVYGISKLAGERWCEYYNKKFKVDVRSLRYPGLISYKAQPGGGTTDYAVHIFHAALLRKKYICYLKESTALPMLYMEDAIRATIELMECSSDRISIRSSYNLSGISFTPKELYEEIKHHYADFETTYEPDHRQNIADSWPDSIDDTYAKKDWNWKPHYDIKNTTSEMLIKLKRSIFD